MALQENHDNQTGNQENQSGRTRTSNRGFASMDPAQQREIASKGGKAAHKSGNAHEFNSDEARIAGRKGGEAISKNRQHMAEIGRRGGEASGGIRNSNHPNPEAEPSDRENEGPGASNRSGQE